MVLGSVQMFVNHEEVKIKNKEFFSIIGLIRNCRVICCFRRQNAWQLDWATSKTVGSSHFRYIRPSRKNTMYQRFYQSHFEECRNTHSSSIFHWNCLRFFPPNLQNRTHKNNLTYLQYKIISSHKQTHKNIIFFTFSFVLYTEWGSGGTWVQLRCITEIVWAQAFIRFHHVSAT